jgi:hypothetical protein
MGGWAYDYTSFVDFKHYVVNYITEEAKHENDLGDIEDFKEKLLALNPLIFNVLNDLLYESCLFDNDDWDGYRYPKISNDEKECIIEFQELRQAYDALEEIESICKKFHYVDDRVTALTQSGYEIKPCWVDSGGVMSTFYMYNKKEIRIQIAASKFMGIGNSKSKSALCVVIPYPKFLHNNRIKLWS